MNFPDAVRHALTHYADVSGRARRSEYWWFVLFNFLVSIVANIVDAALGTGQVLGLVTALALLVPGIAVGVRRLHDTGRSGWLILLALIPLVGAIILIVWFVGDSATENQYGPNPKAASTTWGS